MPTVHDNLIKEFASLMKRIGKKSSPDLIASEMLRIIFDDIKDNPDLWPKDVESQMTCANMLISNHFS